MVGPILFVLHINSTGNIFENGHGICYADDVALIFSVKIGADVINKNTWTKWNNGRKNSSA